MCLCQIRDPAVCLGGLFVLIFFSSSLCSNPSPSPMQQGQVWKVCKVYHLPLMKPSLPFSSASSSSLPSPSPPDYLYLSFGPLLCAELPFMFEFVILQDKVINCSLSVLRARNGDSVHYSFADGSAFTHISMHFSMGKYIFFSKAKVQFQPFFQLSVNSNNQQKVKKKAISMIWTEFELKSIVDVIAPLTLPVAMQYVSVQYSMVCFCLHFHCQKLWMVSLNIRLFWFQFHYPSPVIPTRVIQLVQFNIHRDYYLYKYFNACVLNINQTSSTPLAYVFRLYSNINFDGNFCLIAGHFRVRKS